MLKIKTIELDVAYPVIDKLAKLSTEGKLKFSANYKLSKIVKQIAPELEDYFNEKKKLLEKYCTEIVQKEYQDGKEVEIKTGQWTPLPEYIDKFNKYMNELNSFEVELANVTPFTAEDLDNLTDLSFVDLSKLGPFFEENINDTSPKERKKIKLNIED